MSVFCVLSKFLLSGRRMISDSIELGHDIEIVSSNLDFAIISFESNYLFVVFLILR